MTTGIGSKLLREMRQFSRRELLELVIRQEKENAVLRERLSDYEEQLACREVEIMESGSLAEAALRLNKVFEAADEAAKQYLDNIRRNSEILTDEVPTTAEELPDLAAELAAEMANTPEEEWLPGGLHTSDEFWTKLGFAESDESESFRKWLGVGER